MEYRIEYTDGRRNTRIQGRPALMKLLGQEKRENIRDVRKLFRNGFSETVFEKYGRFIR